MRSNEKMFYVLCEDGNQRHDDDFATKYEACQFAEWGHCCTTKHEILAAVK